MAQGGGLRLAEVSKGSLVDELELTSLSTTPLATCRLVLVGEVSLCCGDKLGKLGVV